MLLFFFITLSTVAMTSSKTIFYTNKMCPFAQKVWIGLNLAGSDYMMEEIQLYPKPSWFIKMNPKGLVPVLKHDDNIIVESEDILDYINSSNYPKSKQYFNNSNNEVELSVRNIIDSKLKPIGKNAVLSGRYTKELDDVLVTLNHYASEHQYLTSNEITMADVSLFPFLYRLHSEFNLESRPSTKVLFNYLNKIMEVEEFSSTIVKSWWWWW